MNELKKKAQVVMLATDKKQINNMFLIKNKVLHICGWFEEFNSFSREARGKYAFKNSTVQNHLQSDVIPQHLYILSDDKIEHHEGEINCFVLNSITKSVYKIEHISLLSQGDKKIIATTDSSLQIRKCNYPKCGGYQNTGQGECGDCFVSLPQPSKDFIQKYITAYNAGTPITEIMVEYERYSCNGEVNYSYHDENYPENEGSVYECNKCGTQRVDPGYNGGKQRYCYVQNTRLKVNSSNEISISKVKDIWTREEVIKLTELAFNNGRKYSKNYHYSDWIKQNL